LRPSKQLLQLVLFASVLILTTPDASAYTLLTPGEAVIDNPLLHETSETEEVAPGIVHRHLIRSFLAGRQSIHIISISLESARAGLSVISPPYVNQTTTLSKLASTSGAVAAVNGDFFYMNASKTPVGVMVKDGVPIHVPGVNSNRPVFAIARDGKPYIDVVEWKGCMRTGSGALIDLTGLNAGLLTGNDVILYNSSWDPAEKPVLSPGQAEVPVFLAIMDDQHRVVETADNIVRFRLIPGGITLLATGQRAATVKSLFLDLCTEPPASRWASPVIEHVRLQRSQKSIRCALAGDPVLVDDGRVVVTPSDGPQGLHPRTAVGINGGRNMVYLVTVDGRSHQSWGMDLWSLARFMRQLGCRDAINLDGGGSTTMALTRGNRTDIVNEPAEGQERPIANGLAICEPDAEILDFASYIHTKGRLAVLDDFRKAHERWILSGNTGPLRTTNTWYGTHAVALTYDFTGCEQTRAAYLKPKKLLHLPDDSIGLGMWVRGDEGNSHWLRALIRDGDQVAHYLTLAPKVDWSGWRYVETELPAAKPPWQLEAIYLVEFKPEKKDSGAIYVHTLVSVHAVH